MRSVGKMKSILRNSLKLLLVLTVAINLASLNAWAAPKSRAKRVSFEIVGSFTSYKFFKQGVTYIKNSADLVAFESAAEQSIPGAQEAIDAGRVVLAISSGPLSDAGSALDLLSLKKVLNRLYAALVLTSPGKNCLSATVINSQLLIVAIAAKDLKRVSLRVMQQEISCD